jgi:type II secretory pathway pseudopilin PulG
LIAGCRTRCLARRAAHREPTPCRSNVSDIEGSTKAAEAGFTLLEALVAFAILSLFLIVTLAGLSQSMSHDRQAELTRRALGIAQGLIDRPGTTEPLVPGLRQGVTTDGFSWKQEIKSLGSPPLVVGYWVEVRVSAPRLTNHVARGVDLATFKVSPILR